MLEHGCIAGLSKARAAVVSLAIVMNEAEEAGRRVPATVRLRSPSGFPLESAELRVVRSPLHVLVERCGRYRAQWGGGCRGRRGISPLALVQWWCQAFVEMFCPCRYSGEVAGTPARSPARKLRAVASLPRSESSRSAPSGKRRVSGFCAFLLNFFFSASATWPIAPWRAKCVITC